MENFVENDDHTLADYHFRCRVCLIKIEIGQSSKMSVEDKAYFFAITGLKLRKNRIFSRVICNMCKRDLNFVSYFKERATRIQTYLNHKGEDCINGSDSEEEIVVLEGFPTFVLNDSDENELSEEFPERLNDAPVENETITQIFEKSNEDLIIETPSSATIPNKINNGCVKKRPGPLKAYQYKPSIANNGQKNKNDGKLKINEPSKEKLVKPSNSKNVQFDNSHIQSPVKVLKEGFPPIFSRRKSLRCINKELQKQTIIAPQVTTIKKKKRKPMKTRSKTIPQGPKKAAQCIVKDSKKPASKFPNKPATNGTFVCPSPCLRLFVDHYNLLHHQRECNTEPKTPPKIKEIINKIPIKIHQCQICNKFYETSTMLNHHELSVHNKIFYCKYRDCKQFFYSKFNLKFHVAIHLGFDNNNNSNNNICEFCGLMDDENAIKQHTLMHMKLKFQCPICTLKFRQIY